jgi:type IX secretion system PorP/SprF family membrane protein
MMVRALLLSVLLLPLSGGAQRIAQYSHYMFNMFNINPAVAGTKPCLDARLGFRRQWLGLDGAPVTGWASMHGALRPKNKPFINNFHGIGGVAEADNAGNWGYTRVGLAYAYNIQTRQDTRMAFGLFAGVQQSKYDWGTATLASFGDPLIGTASTALIVPDITPGFWFYGKRTFAGLSIHHILGNRQGEIGELSRLGRHTIFNLGHQFKTGPNSTFTPSTLVKFAGGAPAAMDINAMWEWYKVFALGAGYRNGDALVLMMRVGFLKFFQLGYTFDLTTSKLSAGSSNTHEIILAINPCGRDDGAKRAIFCPAFD